MIGVLKKIWDFAGEEQGNIRKSMILGFFYAVFHMFQIAAIYVVVLALVGGSTDPAPAWQALGLLLASILGRAVLNRFSQLQQTHAGYFMVANKRIAIGDKLKRVPTGFPADSEYAEMLKLKDFYIAKRITEEFLLADDLLEKTLAEFRRTQPFVAILNRAVQFAYEEMM